MTELTVGDLQKTHEKYEENISVWKFYASIFRGIESVIKGKYITQHEREPDKAYTRRMKEVYGFGYSKSVVRILNFFLFKKPPMRTLGALSNDEQWQMFFQDANLKGDDFDTVVMRATLYSSVYGQIGILVDKSPEIYTNLAAEKAAMVYPYISIYYPPAILDWEFQKDKDNRPYLSMVKLLNDDGTYLIWEVDKWSIWKVEEDDQGNLKDSTDDKAELVKQGSNELGFIPFFWHYNNKSETEAIGVSDLTEIGRIDLSIIKNMSQIEEIINYAAFPMMTRPKKDANPKEVGTTNQDDEVGVTSVMEYDPEYPESKPEWLSPEVKEAIESTLITVAKKVEEIYRCSNIGGLAATEVQTQAKSGTALKTEFQVLNSELVAKAINLEKTENKIAEYWLKWQSVYDKYKDNLSFGRSRTYDVENLAVELANALTANQIVHSKTFDGLLQKQTVRQVIPTITEENINIIDGEIDEYIEKFPEVDEVQNNIDNADDEDKNIIEEGSK